MIYDLLTQEEYDALTQSQWDTLFQSAYPPITIIPSRDTTDPTKIKLTWDAVDGADHYEVSKDGGAFGTTGVTGTTFLDAANSANGVHTYVVQALDSAGNVIAQGTGWWVVERNRGRYELTRNRGKLG